MRSYLIEKLSRPDVLTNVLEALSFILIAPDFIGPRKIELMFSFAAKPVALVVRAFKVRPKLFVPLGGLFLFLGIAGLLLTLTPLISAGPEKDPYYEPLMYRLSLIQWPLRTFVGPAALMTLALAIIYIIAKRRWARRLAVVLGVMCFFAARYFAIQKGWFAP
jgi:type IV secretory pathway VirB2 component (pilin)